MLDCAQKHPELLIEVLENAVQDKPFFMYVDRVSSHSTPYSFYNACLEAIQKQRLQEKEIVPNMTQLLWT